MPQQKNTNLITFDRKQAANKLHQKELTVNTTHLRSIKAISHALADVIPTSEKIDWLEERIVLLESELVVLKQASTEGWVTLERAAFSIGKSQSAIRQMIKNPKKILAKGKVWKQECKGASIYINLKEFRKAL